MHRNQNGATLSPFISPNPVNYFFRRRHGMEKYPVNPAFGSYVQPEGLFLLLGQ